MTEAINFLPYDKPNDYATPMSNALKVGQQAQAEGALSQIDVNNPGSLSAGINALVKAGAADQATTLNTLSQARAGFAQASALRQSLLDDGGLTGNSQSQGASPQMAAMAAHTHAEIANDLSAVAAIPDPQARAQAVAKLQQKYAFLGPDEVKRELGDPTDPNYTARLTGPGGLVDAHKSYAANFSALANGQTPSPVDPHADHADALRALGQDPKKLLALAAFKGIGVDTSSVEKAATEANQPFYNREAEAANAERIAYGTHTGEAEAPGETVLHDAKTGVGTSFPTKAAAAQAIHDNPGKYGELNPYAKSGQEKAGGLDAENPRTTTDVNVKDPTTGETHTVTTTKADAINAVRGNLNGAPGQVGVGGSAQEAAQSGQRREAYSAIVKEATDPDTQQKINAGLANAAAIRSLSSAVGTGAYTTQMAKIAQAFASSKYNVNAQNFTSNVQQLQQEMSNLAKQQLAGIGGSVVRNMGEFKAVTDSAGSVDSQADAVKFAAARATSALNYRQAYNEFVKDYDSKMGADRTNPTAVAKAWEASPQNKSLLADDSWTDVHIGGKPALITYNPIPSGPYKGEVWGLWGEGTDNPIKVRIK